MGNRGQLLFRRLLEPARLNGAHRAGRQIRAAIEPGQSLGLLHAFGPSGAQQMIAHPVEQARNATRMSRHKAKRAATETGFALIISGRANFPGLIERHAGPANQMRLAFLHARHIPPGPVDGRRRASKVEQEKLHIGAVARIQGHQRMREKSRPTGKRLAAHQLPVLHTQRRILEVCIPDTQHRALAKCLVQGARLNCIAAREHDLHRIDMTFQQARKGKILAARLVEASQQGQHVGLALPGWQDKTVGRLIYPARQCQYVLARRGFVRDFRENCAHAATPSFSAPVSAASAASAAGSGRTLACGRQSSGAMISTKASELRASRATSPRCISQ